MRSGISEYSLSNGGYSTAAGGKGLGSKDLDTISTSSSVVSAANGHSGHANVSGNANMNGMQTLPLVRGGNSGSVQQGGSQPSDNSVVTESPKHNPSGRTTLTLAYFGTFSCNYKTDEMLMVLFFDCSQWKLCRRLCRGWQWQAQVHGCHARAGDEALHVQADPLRAPRDIQLPSDLLYWGQRQEAAWHHRGTKQLRIRRRAGLIHSHRPRPSRIQVSPLKTHTIIFQ